MTIELAEIIWMVVGGYLGMGIIFGILFVIFGAPRIDYAAEKTRFSFRLIIIPGVAFLWPIMLIRLLSFRKINAPVEDVGGKS